MSTTFSLHGPLWNLRLGVALAGSILALHSLSAQHGQAQQFRELVGRVPGAANALMILNMEQLKDSPLGQKEDWKKNVEKSFEQGVTRVPPHAARFVLGAQYDWEFMEPIWEVTVMDLDIPVSMERIAERHHGIVETLESLPALRMNSDQYVLQFTDRTLGVMAPANRQAALRWIREVKKPSEDRLSPYLQKAAGYADDAGTDIILAGDLEGLYSVELMQKYLSAKKEQLGKWKADAKQVAKLLADVQGVRLGIKIGERAYGKLVIDCASDVSFASDFAPQLVLELLGDVGAKLDDFDQWKGSAKGKSIALEGPLSKSSIKRLSTLLDSHVPAEDLSKPVAAKTPTPAPKTSESTDADTLVLEATRRHFRTVQDYFDDLKKDMKSSVTLSQNALWFDKYARKIERLSIANVDEDELKYGNYVAAELRLASGSTRNMGIQSNVRQSQIISADVAPYSYGNYRYGRYGGYGAVSEGNWAVYDPYAEARAIASQRRVVRAEEKGKMATDVQTIRNEIIDATNITRQKLTQKYKTEF